MAVIGLRATVARLPPGPEEADRSPVGALVGIEKGPGLRFEFAEPPQHLVDVGEDVREHVSGLAAEFGVITVRYALDRAGFRGHSPKIARACTVVHMTDATETTQAAEKQQANGKPRGKVDPPEPKSEPLKVTVIDGKPADNDLGCEDCGEPGKAATGLGLLICAVAGGLLYIGLDLVTGGGLSRRFGGAREDEE